MWPYGKHFRLSAAAIVLLEGNAQRIDAFHVHVDGSGKGGGKFR